MRRSSYQEFNPLAEFNPTRPGSSEIRRPLTTLAADSGGRVVAWRWLSSARFEGVQALFLRAAAAEAMVLGVWEKAISRKRETRG